jgi:hypothetical protein
MSVTVRNPMKSAGLKTTVSRNSRNHRSGIGLSIVEANLDQLGWALDALDLRWKKEEALALISE